jgi:3-oxoacyl-ACP reductase-like protein
MGPEQAPVTVAPSGERIPVLPTPEAGLEVGLERTEQAAEASAAAADFAGVGAPVAAPPPTAALPAPADDNPVAASDDDVIEKEWVDKAKKIILETKDDPYARSTRVNELQRDYLKKRYSKELGASE